MCQLLTIFQKSCFNDEFVFQSPLNQGAALAKFENRLKKETKQVMDLFMYTDDLLKPVEFCILED